MAASMRQRVVPDATEYQSSSLINDDEKKRRSSVKLDYTLGYIFWIGLASSFLIIYAYIHFDHLRLPQSKTAEDDLKGVFVESHARLHLEKLCEFGPKHVGGYQNEVLAPRYLLEELETIKQQADNAHIIDVEKQLPSGCFHLDFLGSFVNCYYNITNVIARINPKDGSRHSLLVNCHYDSSISSHGASDDVISCSMMLEILRVMSKSKTPFQHGVIFLFNGAEETILQGSHGFMTQHRWAKDVRAFVNLEAAGSGGRELVFQTGPENPWLVSAYARSAPYPSASVVGQEIFQSGIIPSDTDFRIFRDVGGLAGIDVAYIYNGYIYHTLYDRPEYIPPGCMQRGGENLLALVRTLAMSPEVADPGSYRHGNMVFFDVNGIFMVIYPERLGEVLNYFVVLCTLLCTARALRLSSSTASPVIGSDVTVRGWRYARLLAGAWMLHAAASVAVLCSVVAVAGFLTLVRPQCWYTRVWLIVPLYALPSFCSWTLCHQLMGRKVFEATVRPSQREEVVFRAAMLTWTALLLLLTAYQLASAFIPMLLVVFPLFIRVLPTDCKKLIIENQSTKTVAITLAAVFAPTFIVIYQFYGAFIMFLPLTGRSGSEVIPDLVIGIMVAVITIVCTLYMASLLHISRDLRRLAAWAYGLTAVTLVLVACTPLGFPYGNDVASPTPQRHVMQHLHRQFHNKEGVIVKEDSGLFYLPFDYNGAQMLFADVPEFKELEDSSCNPQDAYCGWPYYLPMIHLLRKVYYMPLPPPILSSPLVARLTKKETLSPSAFKFHFSTTGRVHVNIYISPKRGIRLRAWSFLDVVGPPTAMPPAASDRAHYFVYVVAAKEPHVPLQFWIELEIMDATDASSDDALVDIAFGEHYLDGPDSMTPPLQQLLNRLPGWTAPLAWVVTHYAFEF